MSQQLLNLSAILNQGVLHQKMYVHVPVSKKLSVMLSFLRQHGFIGDFKIITRGVLKKTRYYYQIQLVYNKFGQSVLRNIYPISKIRRRLFVTVGQLRNLRKMTILLVISTQYGLLTDTEALQKNIGGEIYCILS